MLSLTVSTNVGPQKPCVSWCKANNDGHCYKFWGWGRRLASV